MWGPFSTAFQFQAVGDFQLVHPSWCLLVRTTYLHACVGNIYVSGHAFSILYLTQARTKKMSTYFAPDAWNSSAHSSGSNNSAPPNAAAAAQRRVLSLRRLRADLWRAFNKRRTVRWAQVQKYVVKSGETISRICCFYVVEYDDTMCINKSVLQGGTDWMCHVCIAL